ncbi:MAG: FAD-dependent oxidoreductase, partial [Proteobacteria bacterium]|nr:FAD-dependent oxidoreductase [Pseudomonadota bacterium]
GAEQTIEAERILVASGRRPNTADLGLKEFGVALTANGGIQVNDRLQSTNPEVYAAGDVTGRHQFVYMAAYGAKLAARNALDCALWDLEAKIGSQSVADLTGFSPPRTFSTMRTVVIDTPENMAKEAAGYPQGVPLKVKLDMEDVPGRLAAIKKGAPGSPIIIDANEGWDADFLESILPELKSFGVILLEQPLPAGKDKALRRLERLVPICADEACHTSADLPRLTGLYDAINIKLDKTGGLTGALALFAAAGQQGFKIMLGCMVSSALSIAPISHLCSHADYIDLDGPLLLAGGGGAGMQEVPGTAKVKLNAKWGRP